MKNKPVKISVIIPALDEEETIGQVVDIAKKFADKVVVADNGSKDNTAKTASGHGAYIIQENKRGYGHACLAAINSLSPPDSKKNEILVFLDADLSDDPENMPLIVEPIAKDNYDLVIGSRTLGNPEPGSLNTVQRFGNSLSCFLMKALFKIQYTDLGPFRAIRRDCFTKLVMDREYGYGWTVRMQARAAAMNMKIKEVPVAYRKRAAGKSKVSGTLRGIFGAGTVIIFTIFHEAFISNKKKELK